MSQDAQHDDIVKKAVLYRIAGMDSVTVRRDVRYEATRAGALTMDIYYPPESPGGARLPAVVNAAHHR